MLRFVALILLWTTLLHAVEDFAYSMHISNPRPVVKEAVILTLELNQTRTGNVMRFDFSMANSDDYQTSLLEEDERQDARNRTHIVIKYAIFPLRPKHLEIPLHVTVQQASPEELKKFVTGSADELTYLRTTDRRYPLPTLKLDVSPVPRAAKIVGDYRLDFSADTNHTIANRQIDLTYTLSGRGYKSDIDALLPPIPGVERFLATEHFDNKLFHKSVYHYALIPHKSFTIPAIDIPAYNPHTGHLYHIAAPKMPISVTKPIPHAQTKTSVIPNISLHALQEIFTAYLVFAAGFLTFHIMKRYRKRRESTLPSQQSLMRKIKDTKTHKALLQLLLAEDSERFAGEIERLEEILYHRKSVPLSHLKREIERKIAAQTEKFDI